MQFYESLLLLSPDKVVDFGVRLDDGPVFFIFWVQHFGILKMLNQTVQSLESGICQNTNLF